MKQAKGDAVRKELLPGQSVALLKELHLVGRDGALHADSLRKLKQVNHLVQLLEPALRDAFERHPEAPVIVDAGAGNAYLGFVLYELFLKSGSSILYSVESRADLMARAQERAKKLGFDRMQFVEAQLTAAQLPERIHVLTALHACDTATDDAIALGIRRNADHIAVVPCCQAEVAAQLKENPKNARAPWPSIWAHPIHRREAGAHLTNVVRALVLQSFGYQVTVTELTGWEHSLKNELILARRVHKDHFGARKELQELLDATGIKPKLAVELELLK
jgi:hypothetical protein